MAETRDARFARKKEDIEIKIKRTKEEFGEASLSTACIIVPGDDLPASTGYIAGLAVVSASTLGSPTLGGASFKVTRFFEDF